MKKDTIVTVLIHHVTAKQAYQIRAIAECSLTAKTAPEEQDITSGTQQSWDTRRSRSTAK